MFKSLKALTLMLTVSSCALANAADNQLTQQEKQAGWQLLFDGKDMSQWRNFKSESLNPAWVVEDGAMTLTKGGGDLLTKKQYQNFELQIDWKISTKGNSGIFVLALLRKQ